MIGLDTNILVRYLTQDDPVQSATAQALIDGLTVDSPGFISTAAMVETLWVLARRYERSNAQLALVIDGFLQAQELIVQDATVHHRALMAFKAGNGDYADAVIVETGWEAGCETTLTFDRRAASALGMTLLTG